MKNLKKFVLDLFFPIQCLGCGREGQWLCLKCLTKIKTKPASEHHLIKDPELTLTGVLVATDYNQPLLQTILHHYKYNFISDLSEELGGLLLQFIKEKIKSEKDLNFDFVVPIPLARKRMIWRGFNQAESLAQKVSQEFSWPLKLDVIIRRYHTHPQVGLNAKDRKNNIKGIFKATNQSILTNKKILLIDDVITTGATMGECGQVLKDAGAKEVWGLVIAKG